MIAVGILVALVVGAVLIAVLVNTVVDVPFKLVEDLFSARGRRRSRVTTNVTLGSLTSPLTDVVQAQGGSLRASDQSVVVSVSGQSVAVSGGDGALKINGSDGDLVERVTGMVLKAARELDPQARLAK